MMRRWYLAFLGCSFLAQSLAGQGPLYRERWADLHLELLRERVHAEMSGRELPMRQATAELLAGSDGGRPFDRPIQALAKLRGVEADDLFQYRASLGCFLLPEVVDPVGDNEACRQASISLFLPANVPLAGEVTYRIDVYDPAGAVVHRGRIEPADKITMRDLRMAEVSYQVPAAELSDGSYRIAVRAFVGDAGPREHDVVLQHRFLVLRGYQARAEAVQQQGATLVPNLDPVVGSMLTGMIHEVNRAYTGEAFDGQSDAVADLERAERALQNLAADRHLLDGISGPVPLALPGGGGSLLYAVVQLPEDHADRQAMAERPLVVVCGGCPAYDTEARRPGAPAFRTARWVHRRVGDLGLSSDHLVVWMQSPGAGIAYGSALPAALEALQEAFGCAERTALVLELEAAVAVLYSPKKLHEFCDAVALVGAGGMGKQQLQRAGEVRILGVPLTGHGSSSALTSTRDVAAGRFGKVEWAGSFELAAPEPRPWTAGAAAASRELAAFIRRAVR